MNLERIFRALDLIGPRDRLVKVQSWRPSIYRFRGRLECAWPHFLVDCINYRAMSSPVWDRARFRALYRKLTGQERSDGL